MMAGALRLTIIRHGQTPSNARRRYAGCRVDEPLSELGREQAHAARPFPHVSRVYVSTLQRAQETAAIMFPNAEQVVVEGIQEMDFGDFTGRTADEMVDDASYRAWVDSWCELPCPGGESRAQFDKRVCAAMQRLLEEAAARGEDDIYVLAHGGTLMAFMGTYADDGRQYFEWNPGNCKGYCMTVHLGNDDTLVVSDVAERA